MPARTTSIALGAVAAVALAVLLSKVVASSAGSQPAPVRVATPPPLRSGLSLLPGEAGGAGGCRGSARLDLDASEEGGGLTPQDRDLANQVPLGLSIRDVQTARSLPQPIGMQKWPQSTVHDTVWSQTKN